MVQKNIYRWILPILVTLYIGSIIILEFLMTRDFIRLKTNEKTILFSGIVLFGIFCIAFFILMFVKNQTQIVQNAYMNCLVNFNADPQFIQKVRKSHFNIKKSGTWEKGFIFWGGQVFDLSVENILGPSKLGYSPYLVLSKKYNSANIKMNQSELVVFKEDLSKRLGLKKLEMLYEKQTVWIKLPITPKLTFEHLTKLMAFLKEERVST